MLYSFISLKDLPDATFPGVLRELLMMDFPIIINAEVVLPDQAKAVKQYKSNLVILLTGRLLPADFPPVTEGHRTKKLEIYFTDRSLTGKSVQPAASSFWRQTPNDVGLQLQVDLVFASCSPNLFHRLQFDWEIGRRLLSYRGQTPAPGPLAGVGL